MNVCDKCGRNEQQVDSVDEDYIGFAGEEIWTGHLCGECGKRTGQHLRDLTAAMFSHPETPKSDYVLEPRRPWWLRVPLAVLLNVLQGMAYGSVSFAVWYYMTTHPKH